jgi:phosphohistidine phosphatase
MKTLYIVRHAKSSWEFTGLGDHERPLMEKGRQRTSLITEYLKKNNVSPDLLISSHATRAFDTAVLIAQAIGYPPESIRINKMFYHANEEDIFDEICEVPDTVQSLMIVGHNPTFTDFANQFLDSKIEWLPTSGVVSVSFNTERWEKIMETKSSLNFIIFPKKLKE